MRPTILVCVVLLCASGVARAQEGDSDKAAAEAAFLKAKDLMKDGKVQEACDAFGRSQKLDPQNGTAYNLALCDEKAGRFASAWTLFRQLAQTDSNGARKKDSDKHAQALSGRLTKMLINVDFEGVPGIIITRNGEDVTATVGIESPIDPGDYTIVATAAGYKSFTSTVSANGEGMTVTVSVPPLEKLKVEKVPDVTTPPPPDDHHDALPPPRDHDRGSSKKLWGMVIGGAGVAIAGTGLVFGALASSNHGKALDVCGGDTSCDNDADRASAQALENSAKSDGNLSTILVGVGGAALATGLFLWLTAPSGHAQAEDALLIAPVVTGDSVAVSIGGHL